MSEINALLSNAPGFLVSVVAVAGLIVLFDKVINVFYSWNKKRNGTVKTFDDKIADTNKKLAVDKARLDAIEIERDKNVERLDATVTKVAQIDDKLDNLVLGTQALLREKLIDNYHYFGGRGCISIDEKTRINSMYLLYEKLGPNGVIDKQHDEFMKLPEQLTKMK